jgi:hypothetical protein
MQVNRTTQEQLSRTGRKERINAKVQGRKDAKKEKSMNVVLSVVHA